MHLKCESVNSYVKFASFLSAKNLALFLSRFNLSYFLKIFIDSLYNVVLPLPGLPKIKIDFVTFLNNLEIAPKEETEIIKTNAKKKEFENNPKCLLVIKKNEKIARNEKCPATGKKYKHCCGFL